MGDGVPRHGRVVELVEGVGDLVGEGLGDGGDDLGERGEEKKVFVGGTLSRGKHRPPFPLTHAHLVIGLGRRGGRLDGGVGRLLQGGRVGRCGGARVALRLGRWGKESGGVNTWAGHTAQARFGRGARGRGKGGREAERGCGTARAAERRFGQPPRARGRLPLRPPPAPAQRNRHPRCLHSLATLTAAAADAARASMASAVARTNIVVLCGEGGECGGGCESVGPRCTLCTTPQRRHGSAMHPWTRWARVPRRCGGRVGGEEP